MNTNLTQSARIAAELRARLAEAYSLDEDDAAIDDTVAGEVDLPEQIAAIARDALLAEAYAEGLAGLIRAQQARKARLDAKAEKCRSLIAWALQESGFRKLPLPDMTLTLSAGKPPLIVDESAAIPPLFQKVTVAPDKTAIRAALVSGMALGFAHLGNAVPTLTIRQK